MCMKSNNKYILTTELKLYAMAPIFYCLCRNCNCTATVLFTRDIKNQRDAGEEDQLEQINIVIETTTQDSQSYYGLPDNMDRPCPSTTEQTNSNMESVLILLCLIFLILGNYHYSFLISYIKTTTT